MGDNFWTSVLGIDYRQLVFLKINLSKGRHGGSFFYVKYRLHVSHEVDDKYLRCSRHCRDICPPSCNPAVESSELSAWTGPGTPCTSCSPPPALDIIPSWSEILTALSTEARIMVVFSNFDIINVHCTSIYTIFIGREPSNTFTLLKTITFAFKLYKSLLTKATTDTLALS